MDHQQLERNKMQSTSTIVRNDNAAAPYEANATATLSLKNLICAVRNIRNNMPQQIEVKSLEDMQR